MKYPPGLILFFLLLFTIVGCVKNEEVSLPRTRPLTNQVFERTPQRIARGKYLSEGVSQCFSCHTPRDWGKPGAPPIREMLGAGQILEEDSLHRIVAPNITPDVETGAGTWTDDMLARAIREGIGHDGRALANPMWYWSFANLSDEDLASIIVYLRTLPPVRNPLPKRRLSAARENDVNELPKPITVPVAERDLSDPVERGRYLADIADCSGCHSAWEAPFIPGVFGGGNLIERSTPAGPEHAFSANITFDPSGILYYDDSLFVEVMRTGRVRARELNAVMPWIVFRNMTDDDLLALYTYLRVQRPVRHIVDNHVHPTPCAMCGQEHGEGEYNVSKLAAIRQIDIDTAILSRYEGVYKGEFFDISFHRSGKQLFGETDGKRIEMIVSTDTLFYAREFPGPIRFVSNRAGRVTHFVSHEDKDYFVQRVD